MGIINFTIPQVGNFIVDIIIWLVKITSSVAVGIILFTVLLKLITLPFDYFSRASMRKNSLKMEEMRPELEKLQKQYADNKELYNQKMMALYKKNGYSMFGACLPTILTLVIFIVAINAFTTYSQYQNKMDFYNMSVSYNKVIYYGIDTDENYIVRNADGTVTIDCDALYNEVKNVNFNEKVVIDTDNNTATDNIVLRKTVVSESDYIYAMEVETLNSYINYKVPFTNQEKPVWGTIEFKPSSNALSTIKYNGEVAPTLACEENNYLKNSDGDTFSVAFEKAKTANAELTEDSFLDTFINNIQSYEAALTYRENQSKFLWVENIWVTDSPLKHPVESSWESFKTTHKYDGNNIGDAGYNKLIAELDDELNKPNGYFILILLTAGISLLSQIVIGKSQQAQMELQTVDGQGAQTQNVMKWMMPIMMAVFAFMYTSAFSLYIILSSGISMLTTLGINAIVDAKFKKEQEKKQNEKIRGRVHTPTEEPKKEDNKKKNSKKKEETPENDFLSGKADKKHIRGRVK